MERFIERLLRFFNGTQFKLVMFYSSVERLDLVRYLLHALCIVRLEKQFCFVTGNPRVDFLQLGIGGSEPAPDVFLGKAVRHFKLHIAANLFAVQRQAVNAASSEHEMISISCGLELHGQLFVLALHAAESADNIRRFLARFGFMIGR